MSGDCAALGEKNFRASSGWWEKVRKRNGIGKSVRLHGEAGEVDHDKIKEKILEIQKALEEYDPEYVYNWDETGLYFRLIPSATYTARNEARKRTCGTKAQKAKDRVTLITCTGLQKSSLPYKSQKNAWNDHVLVS